MHVHLPKPLHGWRAFVGEVGIIVLGVLIALGAEQAIQGFHDRQVAAQSRRDVRDEVAWDLGFYRTRLQESSCIESRLDELSRFVQSGAVPANTVKWVGRAADFAPFFERWRAVTSSARTALFSPAEQSSFDAIYGIFARMDQESQAEQSAWTDLNILQHINGPIDSPTRLVLLRAIEQARRSDGVMRFVSTYVYFHAHRLGITSNPDTSPQAGDVYDVCLPLSMPAEQARELLAPRKPK